MAVSDIEYSELNEIFLYVVRTLKHFDSTFQYSAAKIQDHKKRIHDFLKTHKGKENVISRINHLPDV